CSAPQKGSGNRANNTQMTVHVLGILLIVLFLWVLAWTLPGLKTRQTLLLLASYFFYSNWGLGFLGVLIASSLLNFSIGSLLRKRRKRRFLCIGIITNFLLLGFFKYLPPILSTGGTGSWQHDLAGHIIMPVGMSFWTFQGLSYLFDIYREEEI